MIDPKAGTKPEPSKLVNLSKLITSYYTLIPDSDILEQRVAFGTSGHRGSSFKTTFNEIHILATTQAICEYRKQKGINGPLFIGIDTHALSEPALASALSVLAANNIEIMVDKDGGYTPTPVISLAILCHNRKAAGGIADGIVITPSHNPPEDGGFKYNPPNGGPADTDITAWIEKRANELIKAKLAGVRRLTLVEARQHCHPFDYVKLYVEELKSVINFDIIKGSKFKFGVDPLGGAGVAYWDPICSRYGIEVEVVNRTVDSTFQFMSLDWDGKIRMDCSSPYAMHSLIAMKDRFDVAFANDTDHDRHGIVTRSGGLMNPNHYLAVAINYLFSHRKNWKSNLAVGKTVVSSSMIDRVTKERNLQLIEVPVGFKWFVDGLLGGSLGFGGEESAGASFLREDGSVWTTDKDGLIMDLLAAEMTAATDKDPHEHYQELTAKFGSPVYERIDACATAAEKAILKKLSPDAVTATELAGEKILDKLTAAPGNGAALGGLKVVTANGWFAARPSGTEDVYKIYAESFIGREHLRLIQNEAKELISRSLSLAVTTG